MMSAHPLGPRPSPESYVDFTSLFACPIDRSRSDRLPWKRIFTFLEAIEAESSPEGFSSRTLETVDSLVAYDYAFFAVASPKVVGSPSLFMQRHCPKWILDLYFAHYVGLDPSLSVKAKYPIVGGDWRRHEQSEFTVDFIPRASTRNSISVSDLCRVDGQGFVLVLHRGGSRGYSDREIATLSALYPHLETLFHAAIEPDRTAIRKFESETIEAGLTPREREVASLSAYRYSIREVAEHLRVSPRTVAKHQERIYLKLNVEGRRDLIRKLFG